MMHSEPLAYHAARIILLVKYCGRPIYKGGPSGIKGRTLLAKLDFFIRYPAYLQSAAYILKKPKVVSLLENLTSQLDSVESRMVRYKYGPWDHAYYDVLAYMVGKNLLKVDEASGVDAFLLTRDGEQIAEALARDIEYSDVVVLSQSVSGLFKSYNGNRVKNFIYENFPEIVHLRKGEKI